MLRKVKKLRWRAQLRNFRVRVWSNWDLRRRQEAASGVKSEEREWRLWGWRLRYVIALSARAASEGAKRNEDWVGIWGLGRGISVIMKNRNPEATHREDEAL